MVLLFFHFLCFIVGKGKGETSSRLVWVDFSYLGRTEKDRFILILFYLFTYSKKTKQTHKQMKWKQSYHYNQSELKTEWIISKYSNQVVGMRLEF